MEIKYNLNEIQKTINIIKKHLNFPIIRFDGNIGAGKTTLIKSLCESFGVIDNISSPTFSIVNEYEIDKKNKIYHFDFYRINDSNQALDFGVNEYFESDIVNESSVCKFQHSKPS